MSAQPDLPPSRPADEQDPGAGPHPSRLAYIDATAGVAGDMLLGALVDAGADLDEVQAVLDTLIPGSVRFSRRTVDRCGQQATKVDVELLVEDPPHRTWSSIRTMLEEAKASEAVPARTLELALDAFSRLADAEGLAHGLPPEQIHFHEVGALDSLADVIGACEAWRQLGIVGAVGSVIAVGSGRIRAAHGDIPVPVPAVVRLAQGWPTVAGDLLPGRGHSHAHGEEHGHGHGHEHGHGHPHPHPHGPEHPHGAADHAHEHHHDHGHDDSVGVGHSHSIQEAVGGGTIDPHAPHRDSDHDVPAEEQLAPHVVGGPHARPSRPVPAGVAPGIGELATPTGVALVRALAHTAGPQPALAVDVVGIGAGTKDTPGRPNVVRVMVGRAAEQAASGPGAGPSAAALTGADDAHATPRSAVQLEANVDDLDPRLWPGVITRLMEAGALDAWLTPIIMKQGRPGITVRALVRQGEEETTSSLVMDLTGSLGVRRFGVERSIRARSFEQVDVDGQRVQVKVARDPEGRVVQREPEFRDVQAAARALGISEREALERARSAARES
jgi:uncharacterized protein (DUF111 family)